MSYLTGNKEKALPQTFGLVQCSPTKKVYLLPGNGEGQE